MMRVEHKIVSKVKVPYIRIMKSIIMFVSIFLITPLIDNRIYTAKQELVLNIFKTFVLGLVLCLIWLNYETEKKEVVVHKLR